MSVKNSSYFFFQLGLTPDKAEQPLQCTELKNKDGKYIIKLIRKKQRKQVAINSRLKTISILSYKKAFCSKWETFPEKQQVYDQQPYINISVAYTTYQSINWNHRPLHDTCIPRRTRW